MFDRQYAFDYYTNFVFSVDELTTKILTNDMDNYIGYKDDEDFIDRRFNLIKLLCDKGIISTKKKKSIVERSKYQFSTISLFLTNNCNLRCNYCYEKNQHKVNNMSEEIAKLSINFLLSNLCENTVPVISLFGGEPLLNFELIEFICKYLESHEVPCKFSLTTNGTIMNDKIHSLLNYHDIKVMLSLDGGKEKQDTNRKFENGGGSYDKIETNVRRYLQNDLPNIVVRNTITKKDTDYKKTYNFFREMGYRSLISIPIATINDDEKLSDDDINELIYNCKMIAEDVVNDIIDGKEILNANFFNFGKLYSNGNGTYCGAGIKSVAIDTNGDIYHCHRFVGNSKFRLGNLVEGIQKDMIVNMQSEYFDRLNNLYECEDCWALNLCKGGCMHENLMESGSINKTDSRLCNIRRAWYEITIALYAIICEKDPSVIEKIYGENLFNNYLNKWIPLNIN